MSSASLRGMTNERCLDDAMERRDYAVRSMRGECLHALAFLHRYPPSNICSHR